MKLELTGYSVRLLTPKDADTLQDLYERCADYAQLIDGEPPNPTAAKDEFSAVPEGKGLDDKFMFGLLQEEGLVGLLEAIRRYPDDETWWVGLLLLEPGARGQGMGTALYRAFETYAEEQGATQIMLSVVEENASGFQFWHHIGFEEVRKTEPKQLGNKTHILSVMKKSVDA